MPETGEVSKYYQAGAGGLGLVLVYATFPSGEAATVVARTLVAERLAACVNIIPGMTAIYAWEGVVHEDAEVVAIIKTQRARVEAVFAAVKAKHTYANPALLAVEVQDGTEAYVAWVRAQTA
ncbi:MAG: divalent-cation tolerance protein CutA [Hyphomicrobiaceae bacterium]